jgi:hypothetical protein
MRNKIKHSYKYSSDAKLHILANRIQESLKDNPHFPNPTPAQPDFDKALQEYRQALSVAGRLDRTRVSAKNDKKAILVGMLSELASYVETICQGDKTKLLSSGFDITGIKNETQALQPIRQFSVEIGPPGQATTVVNKVYGARAYVHQCTPDPITADSVWKSETTFERSHTFVHLPSVTKWWFRVTAIGRGRHTVYSPHVSRVIQ